MRKILTVVSAIIIGLLVSFNSMAGPRMLVAPTTGGWEQDAQGWRWKNGDGSYLTDGYAVVGEDLYWFGPDGYIKTGWQQIDNRWVYFDNEGRRHQNEWIDGKYYVDLTGTMLTNTTTPDGYYVGSDGLWEGARDNNIVTGVGTMGADGQLASVQSYDAGTYNNSSLDIDTLVLIADELTDAEKGLKTGYDNLRISSAMKSSNNTILYAQKSQDGFLEAHRHYINAMTYCANYPELAELKSIIQRCDSMSDAEGVYNQIGDGRDRYRNAIYYTINAYHLLNETDYLEQSKKALALMATLLNNY